MKPIKTNQTGFSLAELMVSMAVGLSLTAGVMSIFTGTLKHSNEFVSLAKLDQDLQGILDFIARETRRAGYDADSNNGSDTQFGLDEVQSTATCLLYSYDNNKNGIPNDEEKYGIRWSGDKIFFGSNITGCDGSSGWNAINDANSIQITNVVFTRNDLCLNLIDSTDCTTITPTSGDKLIWKQQVVVEITGKYTKDRSDYQRTVKNTVRLHNEILETYP